MSLLWGITIVPKVWYVLTYTKTKGIVSSIIYRESRSRGGTRTNYYPVVDFIANNQKISCVGGRFGREETYMNDSLVVIYNSNSPAKAFVYDFLGFWATELVFVIPFSLLLTLILGVDGIPKLITIRI
jgi:hypothetical protein